MNWMVNILYKKITFTCFPKQLTHKKYKNYIFLKLYQNKRLSQISKF